MSRSKAANAPLKTPIALLADVRRGDRAVPELSLAQIDNQLALGVDRVMCEGSLYDRELAALAIKQARGDMIEAIFLLRAYRTTLPRFGASEPVETADMDIRRRISATFKDLPGGQVLGPTFDYTHRLLDHTLAQASEVPPAATAPASDATFRSVTELLADSGLIEAEAAQNGEVGDLTREPLSFPAGRDLRLQNLARGDEGFLLALGYSTQRGFGRNHPFAGEIRYGEVEVEFLAEEVGFAVPLGTIFLTECQMVNQFARQRNAGAALHARLRPCLRPKRAQGHGHGAGRPGAARARAGRGSRQSRAGRGIRHEHSDNVQATGFVEHLKLPHYVDFQSELGLLRQLRAEFAERGADTESSDTPLQDAAE